MPAEATTQADTTLPAADDAQPDEAAVQQPAKGKVLKVAIAAAAGIALGIGGGWFVGAPLIARRAAAHPAPAAPHDTASSAEAGPVHLLDNMVLNPAESGGSRFLLISVALQLTSESALGTVKARDAALRDMVLGILGSLTVEDLTDIARRGDLRARIQVGVDSLAGARIVAAVYFPQFVIQ